MTFSNVTHLLTQPEPALTSEEIEALIDRRVRKGSEL
jgi:hypothetical protein